MTIVYTDASWNPPIGCSRVSAGCLHCYAARDACTRLKNVPAYQGLARAEPDGTCAFTGEIRIRDSMIPDPLRKRKPCRFFVCSMSDIFHAHVPTNVRDQMFAIMKLTPWHTYLLLTKRPSAAFEYVTDVHTPKRIAFQAERLREQFPRWDTCGLSDVFEEDWMWWGVSIEDASELGRLEALHALPVAHKWLSLAPLLGRVPLEGRLSGVGWVVIEGESDSDRPCHLEDVRSACAACASQGVPCYVKQLGSSPCVGGVPYPVGRTGGHAAIPAEWPEDLRKWRQMPECWNAFAGDTAGGRLPLLSRGRGPSKRKA